MIVSRRGRKRRNQNATKVKEQPEKLTVAQARKFLGVSTAKMTDLLRQGLIESHKNPIDMREKLIKRSDLEAFLHEHGRTR